MTSFVLGSDFTSASRRPSYFDGRLLSAADLTADQETLRDRDRELGQAAGAGVVRGLEVTSSATAVQVIPGLGVNRAGEPISLAVTATLPLAVPLAEAASVPQSSFRCCDAGPTSQTGAIIGSGVYLLTARPASTAEGARCAASWTVAGIEFRITSLPIGGAVAGVDLTTANRRNVVAHWCFGTDVLPGLPVSPFDFSAAYGLDLVSDVSVDDLPLAVLSWDGQQVADLDLWSVRRRIVSSQPSSGAFALLCGDRRIAEGQARFEQFQAQVAQYVDTQTGGSVRADEQFGWLPPAGFLPVDVTSLATMRTQLERLVEREAEDRADAADSATAAMLLKAIKAADGAGVNASRFFGRLARYGGILDWDLAEFALRDSWHRPPVPTARASSRDGDEPDDEFLERAANQPLDIFDHPIGTPDLPQDQQTPPITVYLVRQNLEQLASKIIGGKRRRPGQGPVRSGLYLFFQANWRWITPGLPPFTVEVMSALGDDKTVIRPRIEPR